MRESMAVRAVMAAVAVFLLAGAARAEDAVPQDTCRLCQTAESRAYFTQAGGKLSRGLLNTLFGWTELFVYHEVPEDRTEVERALFSRPDVGLRHMCKRTIVGVGETFTFWTWPALPLWTKDCAFDAWAGRKEHAVVAAAPVTK